MVKINYEPSDVLISLREPYNKNTVWIHPHSDNIEVKIFDNGWRLLSQTKDIGLSKEAEKQIDEKQTKLYDLILEMIKKQFGKFSSNSNILKDKQKALEERIINLEDKIDKLNKKYSSRNGK